MTRGKLSITPGIESKCVSRCYTSTFMGPKDTQKLTNMKRRGVSEIIATLLLMGITVAGAVLISAFFSGTNLTQAQSNTSTQSSSIKITGYDTRDRTTLSGIAGLDNKWEANPTLCTKSCNSLAVKNKLPSAGGTEFIVLKIRNTGPNVVKILTVEINNVEHSWNNTSGILALVGPPIRYPLDGQFEIMTSSNSLTSDNKLTSDAEVSLLIKLSKNYTSDIGINQPMEVRVFTDLVDSPATSITSGGVR